jgi:isopropylmalate/homocitrate/citramalate synthase
VNGIGEKSGNADLAEVAMALLLLYNKDVGLKYEKLCGLSKLVQKLSGIKMPVNKPIVGDGAFMRESGLTVLQLTTYPPAVEPYPPELVGGKREIVVGKKSGKHSIKWKLQELGITLTDHQVEAVLEKVKTRSIQKKGSVSDEEFKRIVGEVAQPTCCK